MNILIVIVLTFLSVAFTLAGMKHLAPYTINKWSSIGDVTPNIINIMGSGGPILHKLYFFTFLTIAGIIISFITLKIIYNLHDEIEDTLLFFKIVTYTCVPLLIIDILISFYLLIYLLIILLTVFILLYIIFNNLTHTGGNGGSVKVRGHYRQGTYVRSHTRKKPKHRPF